MMAYSKVEIMCLQKNRYTQKLDLKDDITWEGHYLIKFETKHKKVKLNLHIKKLVQKFNKWFDYVLKYSCQIC